MQRARTTSGPGRKFWKGEPDWSRELLQGNLGGKGEGWWWPPLREAGEEHEQTCRAEPGEPPGREAAGSACPGPPTRAQNTQKGFHVGARLLVEWTQHGCWSIQVQVRV